MPVTAHLLTTLGINRYFCELPFRLMVACTADILDSVRILRQHNADYYIFDNGGCTAIHWAVDARSVKLLDWMAQDKADFNVKDRGHGGWTPLIRCGELKDQSSLKATHEPVSLFLCVCLSLYLCLSLSVCLSVSLIRCGELKD